MIAAALDQLPALVAVTTGDEQRLVMINDAGRAMVGERPVGAPLTAWADLLGQQVIERYHETWHTGEPFTAEGWRLEYVGPDGSPIEVFVDFTLAPVRGPDGEMLAVVGFGQDTTRRVRRRQEEQARSDEIERRYVEANEVLVQLHDAMLPKGLPTPQGVQLAARYLLAGEYTGAGGDWFDAVPVPGGRIALVVGDVVGHGVEASVVMGELKTLFEERVRQDGDLVAALELLDARASRVAGARATTVCAGVLEPATGDLLYCTAGHPPPVVVTAAAEASFLPTSGAGPLGSGRGFATARHRLAEGDLLLLYSDGLVERPGRGPAQSTVELLRVAADAVRGIGPVSAASGEEVAERVCRQTLELLTRITGYTDDITLLAAQVVAPVAPLNLRLAAVPDVVRTVRADLGDWLADLRISALDLAAVQHAVGELVSNVVQHAYPAVGVDNEVRVRAGLSADGVIELEVADDGRWAEPSGSDGRGLVMAHGLLDELDLRPDDAGTRARGRHRPTRPASLLRGTSPAPPPVPVPSRMEVDDDAVRLSGVLDLRAVEELRMALARSSHGGTRSVTVDLGGVELLSSAAVQILFAARAAGPVDLVASIGSAAQHVLDLVGLPYRSDPDRH